MLSMVLEILVIDMNCIVRTTGSKVDILLVVGWLSRRIRLLMSQDLSTSANCCVC